MTSDSQNLLHLDVFAGCCDLDIVYSSSIQTIEMATLTFNAFADNSASVSEATLPDISAEMKTRHQFECYLNAGMPYEIRVRQLFVMRESSQILLALLPLPIPCTLPGTATTVRFDSRFCP